MTSKKTLDEDGEKKEALEQPNKLEKTDKEEEDIQKDQKESFKSTFAIIRAAKAFEEPEEKHHRKWNSLPTKWARCTADGNRNKTKKTRKRICARCWKIFAISFDQEKTDDGIKNDWCKQSASTWKHLNRQRKLKDDASWLKILFLHWAQTQCCKIQSKSTRK